MTEATYEVYCGNFDCSNRALGKTFTVTIEDLPDGEVWICPDCRPEEPS